ncbi:MAG: hypothetical protein ACE5GA_09715 [Candidatus Zixiibacteriota bacterium]
MTREIRDRVTTVAGQSPVRLSIYDSPDSLDFEDRREALRVRGICDEYLAGALLKLPRVIVEGAFWPSASRRVIADCSAGLVVCRNIESWAAEWPVVFTEVTRMLAPGGIFYLNAPDAGAFFDSRSNLPLTHRLPGALAQLLLALALREDQPVYRALERSQVWKLSDGTYEVFDYTHRDLPGAPALQPGIIEFSLIKSF